MTPEPITRRLTRPWPAATLGTMLTLVAIGITTVLGPAQAGEKASLAYPAARKEVRLDNYHGKDVDDPYRWLEDADSEETRAWVEAQNKVTFGYLDGIAARARIKERLTKLWNYERYSTPVSRGGRYFFSRNDGLQNQSVIYTMKGLDGEPKLLLDPNKLSADGTVALAGAAYSDDGRLMAYATSSGGSDWQEWKVRDVESGADLADHIKWSKFSGASWTPDGKGFYYGRYDAPTEGTELTGVNYWQKLYFHRVGTPQSEDVLAYERKDQKEWGFGGAVTDDGRYLIITISAGTDTRNRLFYRDLSAPTAPVVELLGDFDASYNFIDNDGPVFWILTDLAAPRGRVIAIDTRQPARSNWKEIIPQTAETLTSVNVVNHQFIANYLKDARSRVAIFGRDGGYLRDIDLPGIGSAGGFSGRRTDTETFFSFSSFTTPSSVYRYDVALGKASAFRAPKVDFNPSDYETRQVQFTSKDGTRVPMFITHKKGMTLNGGNATYLYAYGGFNISMTPSYSVSNLVWMEMGGVYAMACLRGGGEYGEEWHKAGTKLAKQNVFDDFIAAAEWLVENKYTRPSRLAIGGGSNGGLLIGAVLNQRPDLFGAALPAVGVMDMLRFHKFTIGWAWASDYGSSDDPEQFKALYAYSPLHNIKPGTAYPAVMVTTADHDDRVVPAHSFKYAAALQAAQSGKAPTLIRIETRAGHGAGKPVSKQIDESADRLGFLVHELGMEGEGDLSLLREAPEKSR